MELNVSSPDAQIDKEEQKLATVKHAHHTKMSSVMMRQTVIDPSAENQYVVTEKSLPHSELVKSANHLLSRRFLKASKMVTYCQLVWVALMLDWD